MRLQNESGLVLPKILICLCAIICIQYLLEILSMPFCALGFGSKILLKNCSHVNQFVSVAWYERENFSFQFNLTISPIIMMGGIIS